MHRKRRMATIGERLRPAVESAQQGCTISVNPEIRAMADELAHLLRLDTDTFVAVVIHDLYQDESVSSALAVDQAGGRRRPWRDGHVIARLVDHLRQQRSIRGQSIKAFTVAVAVATAGFIVGCASHESYAGASPREGWWGKPITVSQEQILKR